MEAVEELSMRIPGFEDAKDNVTDVPVSSTAELAKDCHRTNGVSELPAVDVGKVADSNTVELPQSSYHGVEGFGAGEALEDIDNAFGSVSEEKVVTSEGTAESSLNEPATADSGIDTANEKVEVDSSNISEADVETSVCPIESTIIETDVESSTVLDSTGENVKFETEVLVEQEENVISTTNEGKETLYENEGDNKILSELDGHTLDLREALGTPDVPDGAENNNSNMRQEVFNKEELLDILEGNDQEPSQAEVAQRALKQLKKLAKTKRKMSSKAATTVPEKPHTKKAENKRLSKPENQLVGKTDKPVNKSVKNKPKEENIVKALVQDWEDDEPEDEKANKVLKESEQLLQASEELVEQQACLALDETKPEVDSTITEDQSLKTSEENPQKRLSRVIKKKVIFDPDNPDTFTKGKIVKTKEPQLDKETPPLPKKVKTEQAVLRATSKSPVNKTQWKKPTPKKSAQYKRLSEVDKLLMDEGAVNMIYQLTPEAPKGRKNNMRTKAEFIKKINQSSKPDAKEMKFRERKKDMPKEEGEGKKGLRASLSGSVKSASVGEDFENTSADDSIIYRRHSSSSYSSTCMSPRRLSDVEGTQTVAQALQQTAESISAMDIEPTENGQLETKDIFMADISDSPTTETIKKKDCMTLKQKLNSKLSNVLNKRKREIKTDKPMKQKKLTPKLEKNKDTVVVPNFKTLTISFDEKVAKISISKSEGLNNLCGSEELVELKQALELVNNTKDTSITLLTSESGSIFSNLDLKSLLVDNMERKISHALEITASTSILLSCLEEHSKVLVCGVDGACEGLSLAILALCDVGVASERASFALAPSRDAPPVPGIAVLSSPSSRLSHALVTELVICGRRLSASEAMERGLVSRVLWPTGFGDQLLAWAKDLAAQPAQSFLLKKKLLSGVSRAEAKTTFQARLAAEQDQLTAFWSSLEGQESLRALLSAA